jgi:hypothetical protein
LKNNTNWEWTTEKQAAFQNLRESFPKSAQLVHPNEEKPYEIYTNASKIGISAILTQEMDTSKALIVSTASRVLSEAEKKYTTCEQELLAVVYALQKFRTYVTGRPTTVYSDNKALTFIKKCNLISGRVTRWIMQLQEYDLTIKHIKGTENFFADALSRNPIGLSKEEQNSLKGSREISIAKISIYTDKRLSEELKYLNLRQLEDSVLSNIREKLMENVNDLSDTYMIRHQILYYKSHNKSIHNNHPYWRIMLPQSLEDQVIKYTHNILGHQGTSKSGLL